MSATFSDWMGSQMDRVGIRSGRRLALETGLDEELILDWAIGRRVPQPYEVDLLAPDSVCTTSALISPSTMSQIMRI